MADFHFNKEDYKGFLEHSANRIGQITPHCQLGRIITSLAADESNKIFLDIGVWNSHGSTQCLVKGFLFRNSIDDVKYIGLEVNKRKLEYAREFNKFYHFMEFHNSYLTPINENIDEYDENYDIITEYFEVDVLNMKHAMQYTELEPRYDVVIFDGGDYTSYDEVMLLKDWTKYLVLDDVNSLKNRKARKIILDDDENFELLHDNLQERNGYSVFKNISL